MNTRGGRSKSKAPAAEAVPAAVADDPADAVAEVAPQAEVALQAEVAPEPVLEVAPEPVPEVAPEPVPEPVPEVASEPAVEPEPEPEPVAAELPEASVPSPPVVEPAIAPAVEPVLAPVAEPVVAPPAPAFAPAPAAGPERCAQCGAPLSASDIFCPECGYVRHREGGRARPSDTNILDPFPWGLPRSTEPVATHQHAPVAFEPDAPPAAVVTDAPAKPFADIADVSETRLVPRGPRGDRYVLQFSTGESVSVAGTGLVGRNPVVEPGEYVDTLIAIVDPGRSVSKTHLEFGQDDTSFWVSDRYSGNGTVVREPDREPRRCEAGKRYRVMRGARVEIGEQFFIVS